MKNIALTIVDEFSGNGEKIAKALSKDLNIPFWNDEIIKLAAKESGISEAIFYTIEDLNLNTISNPFPISFSMVTSFYNFFEDLVPITDKVFNSKSKIINQLANKGSCIISSKCSNYILKNNENCINILVYSDLDKRTKNLVKKENIPFKSAKKIVRKKDKKLEKYYKYFTAEKWDKKENYDILININKLNTSQAMKIIKNAFLSLKS